MSGEQNRPTDPGDLAPSPEGADAVTGGREVKIKMVETRNKSTVGSQEETQKVGAQEQTQKQQQTPGGGL